MALTEQEVATFINAFQEAYNAKDHKFFDFFDKDATFFAVSSATRIDGLEEYRRGFSPVFGRPGSRRGQVLSPEIKILADTAIVTYHNRIVIDDKIDNLLVSLVAGKDASGNLKIYQYHSSYGDKARIPMTFLGIGAKSLEEVALLEERVATAASNVGTPK